MLGFGLTAVLYTNYAMEPENVNTMEVADGHNYSAVKWCFVSSLLARYPPVWVFMQAISISLLLIVANYAFIVNDPLTSIPWKS